MSTADHMTAAEKQDTTVRPASIAAIFNVLTAYRPAPIPFRHFDWTAWRDGHDELTGQGSTEAAAIADLLEQEREQD